MPLYLTLTLALLAITCVQAGRVLLSLYALKPGADPFAVGILAGTSSALPLLLSWQVGRLSDRFGSRLPLTVGAAGGALGLRITANHLARMIAPVVFGMIGAAFGVFPVFWGNALMLASGGLLSRSGAFARKK